MSKESRFLDLHYETAFENLGNEFYDEVRPAKFPKHILRWRNDDVITSSLGLDPTTISDEDIILAFGAFQGRRPFLATRYHGYQFGTYNPTLGDGRGFIYGQVRGTYLFYCAGVITPTSFTFCKDNILYDFGTKGSGTTQYSRGLDGRLTLKGGVRELIAAETLHRMGVNTSRCFSLIETGEKLTRSDEPSPTRSCVLVRYSKSHIRFGTFERLQYIKRLDLLEKLLDHVISIYYPQISETSLPERRELFYKELCIRVARLVAQWMSEGFCHGVLNTDNMNINGESFDYGPYGFIHAYNPEIVATGFDYTGRHKYGKQVEACRQNLMMFGETLKEYIPKQKSSAILQSFNTKYSWFYQHRMLLKLGITNMESDSITPIDQNSPHAILIDKLIRLLHGTQVKYHIFFAELRKQFSNNWRESKDFILKDVQSLPEFNVDPSVDDNQKVVHRLLNDWKECYCEALSRLNDEEFKQVPELLVKHNVLQAPTKYVIDDIWKEIYENDNWQPINNFMQSLKL